MHDGDHPSLALVIERLHKCVVRNALTPVSGHSDHPRPMPPRDLSDPAAEEAALGDDHRVARLEQVGDTRLHAGRAGAVEREHEAVRHPVHAPEQLDDVEQDLVHLRVEVAEHRPRHGFKHRWVHVRGTRAAEQPLGRAKLGESVVHPVRVPYPGHECKLRVLRNT